MPNWQETAWGMNRKATENFELPFEIVTHKLERMPPLDTGHRPSSFRKAGLLRNIARVVGGIHIFDRPGTGSTDLNDRLLIHTRIMNHVWRERREATRADTLLVAGIGYCSVSD